MSDREHWLKELGHQVRLHFNAAEYRDEMPGEEQLPRRWVELIQHLDEKERKLAEQVGNEPPAN